MQVCRGIYQFMTDEGFSLAPRVHFRSLMNHFPHTYLTTNKSTIPISLVHVALHLARHVGLDVSPVNFPGTVLGRVETGDAQPDHFFLINPSAPDINDSILLPNFGPTLTLPGDAEQLILRASRNVEASLVEKTNQTREFASAAASYVAQEHVQKIALTADLAKSFVTNNSLMSVYFSDVQLVTEDNDRGVFKPSADLKQVYPDDEWYAARRATPQQAVNYFYRPGGTAPTPQRPVADVRDDYERWYTEAIPNNRMSLSLRSGILSEVAWALDRLCRLAHNDHFSFKAYPGLIDGLFDWPEWYVNEGYKEATDEQELFSPSRDFVAKQRYALESLFILKNGALQEANAQELQNHSHTLSLILNGLHNLDFNKDQHQEALLHIIDIFHGLAPNLLINESVPDCSNPIIPLKRIVFESKNRSLIIGGFNSLNGILSHPGNALHFSRTSESLNAAIRYLPLFMDKQLLESALEHIYIHVAHSATARALLLHPQFASLLKVLCSLILSEQQSTEEKVTMDITPPHRTAPATTAMTARNYEIPAEELNALGNSNEPHRCYEWMRLGLSANKDAEITQVDIWNLYKETFTPYQDQVALLGASDVIKYVTHVFPTAQAMVLPGTPNRFIVRGIERRQELIPNERFKCLWNRSSCPQPPFTSPSELFDHLSEHLAALQPSPNEPCVWATCSHTCAEPQHLRSHLLTHLSSSQPLQKHPSQSDTITYASGYHDAPGALPTMRPIPPARNTVISYEKPIKDPSSLALTAVLILRVLFRTAFASAEAAPKADADHFGFPGAIDDANDPANADAQATDEESDKEGERRGRKAFVGVRNILENIRLRDEALMSWITEMVDATIPDLH
ncbi:hypothetical protein EST38_g1840 [Candolleomyces aberdarensis]|uniref:RFX-type winged-helix domain-containing protein n=1 Tax=Candolleomyces aberdarensis TaxID=2316362 RepID=A0A4Q2DXJ9_9AGAR|nr:hypothetical protein EST38_g1840 [Candolleomyces aberdarensis]